MFKPISKKGTQLVAHCFFTKAGVEYQNYEKYYRIEEEQHILDMIEADADY